MNKPTTAARILSTIANAQAIYSGNLAERAGVSKATAIRHARKLAEQGFTFCEDDFDGRRRKGGKYANALWVINCETNGFTAEVAQRALDMVDGDNGWTVMVEKLGLGC